MGLTVVGNLLHVSSYRESNIIHIEHWSIVGWTTHKMLPFCSGPTLITSCLHRKDTRLSSHIHNFVFQTRGAWEWGYSFGNSIFSWSSPWYQPMEWSHWLCHDDVMVNITEALTVGVNARWISRGVMNGFTECGHGLHHLHHCLVNEHILCL